MKLTGWSEGIEWMRVTIGWRHIQNKCVSWCSLEDAKDIKRRSHSISASLKETRLQTAHLHRCVGSSLQHLLLHLQPELSLLEVGLACHPLGIVSSGKAHLGDKQQKFEDKG